MAENISQEEVETFQDKCEFHEEDGDGTLTGNASFLELTVDPLSLTDPELMKVYDRDGDGKLDKDEFERLMKGVEGFENHTIEELFRMFDINNDGFIDIQELRPMLETMGDRFIDPAVLEAIQSVDEEDRSDFIEFLRMVHIS